MPLGGRGDGGGEEGDEICEAVATLVGGVTVGSRPSVSGELVESSLEEEAGGVAGAAAEDGRGAAEQAEGLPYKGALARGRAAVQEHGAEGGVPRPPQEGQQLGSLLFPAREAFPQHRQRFGSW